MGQPNERENLLLASLKYIWDSSDRSSKGPLVCCGFEMDVVLFSNFSMITVQFNKKTPAQ
jgi:hypothetical protein